MVVAVAVAVAAAVVVAVAVDVAVRGGLRGRLYRGHVDLRVQAHRRRRMLSLV